MNKKNRRSPFDIPYSTFDVPCSMFNGPHKMVKPSGGGLSD